VRLAIIIPVYNRAATIEQSLRALEAMRGRGHHVIVVDGGSSDDSTVRASALADRVLGAPRGLSRQLNAGSRVAEAERADALVFVPEAVRLPAQADRAIARALSNSTSPWGRFDLCFDPLRGGTLPPLRLAAALANWGSRVTGICTWEQAIFVSRCAFLALDGFAGPDASADVEFSRRARQLGAPIVLREPAVVSPIDPAPSAVLRSTLQRERRRLACALGFHGTARWPLSRSQF